MEPNDEELAAIEKYWAVSYRHGKAQQDVRLLVTAIRSERIAANKKITSVYEESSEAIERAIAKRNVAIDQLIEARGELKAERTRTETLTNALERTLHNFCSLLQRLPVRDADETIAEAKRALALVDSGGD